MENIKVEIVKATVTELSATINFEDSSVSQLNTNQSASVFEPNDESDPTVLIKSESTMMDSTGECLNIKCKVDFIVKFDPIPQERSKVASELCPALIHAELAKIVSNLLHDMGHDIAIS